MIARVSSSVENWRAKILSRYDAEEYRLWRDFKKPAVFFGLYHPRDWLVFMLHRGKRTAVFCGSDILQIGLAWRLLKRLKATWICENEVEAGVLKLMLGRDDIWVEPLCFSESDEFPVCYQPSDRPSVFIHINHNAEAESGWAPIERIAPMVEEISFHIYGKMGARLDAPSNVVFHGWVPEEQFNQEIRGYQAALRLHEWDGFAETLAKSVLLGQWPISRIRYPLIDSYRDEAELIEKLRDLKNKKEPNWEGHDYYVHKFENSL